MAYRTRIYRATLRVHTLRIAVPLVEQIMYEVDFGAQARVATGPYTTGNLASRMFRRGPFVTGKRVSGRVGNNAPYARIVHDGARVHAIFPKGTAGLWRFGDRRRPQLKFFWRKAGGTVYMPHVPGSLNTVGRSHPGQKGKHFLTESLLDVAARRGLKVVVYDI